MKSLILKILTPNFFFHLVEELYDSLDPTVEEAERERLNKVMEKYKHNITINREHYLSGGNNNDTNETSPVSPANSDDSVYSKLIHKIRSGSEVSVCTVKSNSSSESISNEEVVPVIPQETSSEKGSTSSQWKEANLDYKPKKIIIISKKLGEGEAIPPLPSWFDILAKPDGSGEEAVKVWEKDL